MIQARIFQENSLTVFLEIVPISDSLLESYFKVALTTADIDLIVVIAHIDPQTPPELFQIWKAIRKFQPDLPIALLSGHRHREYFQWFDSNCFTIESGKYFQSVVGTFLLRFF
jgi:hypothetical protein